MHGMVSEESWAVEGHERQNEALGVAADSSAGLHYF